MDIEIRSYELKTPTCKTTGTLVVTGVSKGKVKYTMRGPKEPGKSVQHSSGEIPVAAWGRFLADKGLAPVAPPAPVPEIVPVAVAVPVVETPTVAQAAVEAGAPPAAAEPPKRRNWRSRVP